MGQPGTVGCAKAVPPHDTRITAMPVSVLITIEFSITLLEDDEPPICGKSFNLVEKLPLSDQM